MPITTRVVPNVGSPPGDPTMLLPGKLYIPDSSVHPPPWPCLVATMANDFSGNQNGAFTALIQPLTDLANAGFLCLQTTVRLMGTHPPPGQTTDGKWHQQTDDLKIAVQAMRSNPFGFGYSVTGYVAALGGSGSAHHALWMALEGTLGVEKVDAAICLSPPTDFSDREADVSDHIIGLVTDYGRSTDLPTLLSESPIVLDLAHASPILHYNGNAESPGMPLSMWTRFKNAMIAAGGSGLAGYTAIENFGTLGTMHSFKMWSDGPGFTGIGPDAIAWLLTTVTPPPPPIPNPPSVLTAVAISTSAIDLAWHDNSANEDGFKIERSLDGTTWAEIFETGPNIVVFHDTGLAAGTLYFYRVRAFNAGGDSAYSNTASATTNSPLPGTLHTPTFTPSGSPDSNTDTTIACSDAGSHIFYTIGVSPPGPNDPTHSGDSPTGSTFRIGSNSGVVNSGGGVIQFKAMAYESGFIDSDIATSDTFGTPPVVTLQPILTGFGDLLSSDQPPPNRLGDISGYPEWHMDYVDFFRYRGCWNNLEPTEGNYFWDDLDAIFDLATANNKFISLSVAAGEFTPQWVYDSGAVKYGPIHFELPDTKYQPLPWDPAFQVKWFAFLNALAIRYANNDRLRAMIDAGFMPVFSMFLGDVTDEAAMSVTGSGFDYPDIHAAYRAGAQAILTTTFSLFPNIGHAITYTQVWDDDQHRDANFIRDWYRGAYPGRAGTIVTSDRATLPPHNPPDPNRLVAYPSYGQEFWPMTARATGKTYEPPEPVPLPPALQCLQDCLENTWSKGQQYLEVYRGDLEFPGAEPTFLIEQGKLKSNLLGAQPPTCPPGQHWDPILGECVPDPPPTCPDGTHWDPVLLQCVPDNVPLPPGFKMMLPILENAQLGSDIDFQNNFLLNPGLLLPCPSGLLEINDVRLMDARVPLDGSITNDSVKLNAGIQQSKLNFSSHIPNTWTGHGSDQAAAGNAYQPISEKGQVNGYLPLRNNGTFDPAFLASTGPQVGTVTFIGLVIGDPFETFDSIDHGSGFMTPGWLPAPPYSWFGVTSGIGFDPKLVPSYLTEQIPTSLIPSLAASKFTSGTFDLERLPVAVGMGVSHAAGVVPDTGSAVTVGSESDYLGRDMNWHSFEDVINPQPDALPPNIILQSYFGEQGSIRIQSALKGSNLFYRILGGFSGVLFVRAPSTDYTLLVDVGDRVDAYSAKSGYNNSEIVSFTVPPIPTG